MWGGDCNNNVELELIVLIIKKYVSGLSQTGFIIEVKKHPPVLHEPFQPIPQASHVLMEQVVKGFSESQCEAIIFQLHTCSSSLYGLPAVGSTEVTEDLDVVPLFHVLLLEVCHISWETSVWNTDFTSFLKPSLHDNSVIVLLFIFILLYLVLRLEKLFKNVLGKSNLEDLLLYHSLYIIGLICINFQEIWFLVKPQPTRSWCFTVKCLYSGHVISL